MTQERRANDSLVLHRLDTLDSRLDRIEHVLVGNGDPGLKGRVDRLEQAHASQSGRSTTWYAALVSAVTGAASAIAVWWTTGGQQ